EEPTSYNIDLNGNVMVDDANRVRFSVDLRLATNQAWQELTIRITLRPSVWELQAVAATESIRLHIDDGVERLDKTFKFADLRNPDKLVKDLGGPLAPALLSPLGIFRTTPGSPPPSSTSLGLEWQGRFDRLRVGGDWMRVYRLQARLLDRFQAVIFVSPVGEILKIELPDQLVLLNDALANLSGPEDDRTDSRR